MGLSKKKIAIVTNTSWNILNFRSSLIQFFQTEYDVILIAPKDQYSTEIELLAPTFYLKHLSRKGTNPINDFKLIQELKSIYKKEAVDLAIHFTIKPNIYGSIAARKVNIPSIAVVTGLGYTFLSNGLAATVAKKLYKYAFQRNSITIFQNPDDRNLFIEQNLVSPEKSSVIYGSGIDLAKFTPLPKSDWHNGFHFLFIGRLLYDKGVRELLNAFQMKFANKEVYLHLVGEIDLGNPSAFSEEALMNILGENPNIIFHGRVNGPNQLIANCDCVILPSYREGLPRVILEALAMARPVIVTDVAGCKETVIHKKNGYIVKVQSEKELAEMMYEMSNLNEIERFNMGQEGKKMAENKFSTTIINQEFHTVVQRFLDS